MSTRGSVLGPQDGSTDSTPPGGGAAAIPRPRAGRIAVLDWLGLLVAALAAVLAWTILFRGRAAPERVDPLLGTTIDVTFDADVAWKRSFPAPGTVVLLDDYLRAEVLVAVPAPDAPGRRDVTLRVLDRPRQEPNALGRFRHGVWRGARLRVRDPGPPESEVDAEVTGVEPRRVD